MLRKNFLIMSLKTVPALFAMVFFLGSVLIMPTWAMEQDEDQEKSSQSIVRIQNKAELDKYLKDDESRSPNLKIEGFTPSEEDLEKLIHPSLRSLDLSDLQITAMPNLKMAHALEELYMQNTLLVNISPVAKAPNLRKLNLAHTKVTDVSPLKDMETLDCLNLCSTSVNSISPLPLGLRHLNISFTPVGFSELEKFTNLTNLTVGIKLPPEVEKIEEYLPVAQENPLKESRTKDDLINEIAHLILYNKTLEDFHEKLEGLKMKRPNLNINVS